MMVRSLSHWLGVCLLIGVLSSCAPPANELQPSAVPTTLAQAASPIPPTNTPTVATQPATATPQPTLELPATPAATRDPVAPFPLPVIEPPADASAELQELLKDDPERYCGMYDFRKAADSGCYQPLAIQIADYLMRHPDDPYKDLLYERMADLNDAWTDGEYGHSRRGANTGWIFNELLHTASQTLPHELGKISQPVITKHFRFMPANFDGDALQDYIVEGGIYTWNPYVPSVHGVDVLSLRWIDNQWHVDQMTNLLQPESIVYVGDLSKDGRSDVVLIDRSCNACPNSLKIFTWQNNRWVGDQKYTDARDWKVEQNGDEFKIISNDPFRLRFEFHDGFIPVEFLGAGTESTDYAQVLMQLGNYPEAIQTLEEVIRAPQYQVDMYDGKKAVLLFRIAMIQVLQGKLPEAQATWQNILKTYPDQPPSRTIKTLDLPQFNGTIRDLCQNMQKINPLTWYEDQRQYYVDHFHDGEDWRGVCNPEFLLLLQSWQLSSSLADQMQAVGLVWQEISADYDLNNDGIKDPIGMASWQEIPTYWAMVSTPSGYQPINVVQPWNTGTTLDRALLNDTEMGDYTYHLISDLDNDGWPELFLDSGVYEPVFMRWNGSQFDYRSLGWDLRKNYTPDFSVTIEQSGGDQLLKLTPPITDDTELLPEYYSYKLVDGLLMRIEPADLAMVNPELDDVQTALFGEKDITKAMTLLDIYESHQPPVEEVMKEALNGNVYYRVVLRGLMLEYTGKTAESQAIWEQLKNTPKAGGWQIFAQEHTK